MIARGLNTRLRRVYTNTLYSVGALASGLAQTGSGVVTGAKDTAGIGEQKKSGGGGGEGIDVKDLEGAAKKD